MENGYVNKSCILIAEIGNNHFGSFSKAKELIHAAVESGADLVKGQAYSKGAISGSMPETFYENCRFRLEEYVDLIHYARSLNSDLFYSIFTIEKNEIMDLAKVQHYHKIPASMSKEIKPNDSEVIETFDKEDFFISLRPEIGERLPWFGKANILYASEYMTENPNLDFINKLSDWYGRPCGYSDHSIGIEHCLKAITVHKANVLEKHFTLKKSEAWCGQIFRDTVHGATPQELKQLKFALDDEDFREVLH